MSRSGILVHAYNVSTQKAEASKVSGQSGLHSKFKVNLALYTETLPQKQKQQNPEDTALWCKALGSISGTAEKKDYTIIFKDLYYPMLQKRKLRFRGLQGHCQ
jgi:hypothetical protein